MIKKAALSGLFNGYRGYRIARSLFKVTWLDIEYASKTRWYHHGR
jgi:hypothetical protein